MLQQIEAAQIILLLISPNLLASEFNYIELQRTLERCDDDGIRVVPILLSPTDWRDTPFAKFGVLPKDGRPITEWENREDAFRSVTQGIQFVAEQIQKDQQGVSLDMVAIPGGTFLMGSSKDEIGYRESEEPQHEVTIQPFFMSKTPITQAQWRAVAELDPVERELEPDPASFKGDDRPVEKVSWLDATEFCARLSRLSGRDYRLPTEAEWEYACRAGTTTPFAFGETLTGELANYASDEVFAQEEKGEWRQETTPVATFPPNAFGLYDMHGNVWEWCEDHWHSNYEGVPPTDGSAWLFSDEGESSDRTRMLRGGSWGDSPRNCRSACRLVINPDARYFNDGFRVVCSAARDSS
jgi:formylglycine-generating enzyme required for sulfatase activity